MLSRLLFSGFAVSVAVLTSSLLSCSKERSRVLPSPEVTNEPAASAATHVAAISSLSAHPLVAEAPRPAIPNEPLFTELEVAGHPNAVISLPNGATSKRPVVIVLHGSGDRPDWNCDCWRHITGAHGFVLCPRGEYNREWSSKDDSRYTHRGTTEAIRAHIDDALESLRRRYPDVVDVERPLLAGFSLGAWQAGRIAARDPEHFPRVAQLEGGLAIWNDASLADFSKRGGLRILYACGQSGCLAPAKFFKHQRGALEFDGVSANVGHSYDRRLQTEIMTKLDWFLGDEKKRWGAPL